MKTFLKLLLLLPVALAGVAIDIANRHPVTVFFDPFTEGESSGYYMTARLSVVLLVAVMIGVLLGGIAMWFEQGRHRQAARKARGEAKTLRSELARRSDTQKA
ncbi:LapA family protein [Methylocapsa palsarum]|uniref:Lipopolysaccharide assembly protein A domain-containing protein n=1 Tax=Methylocapsa palsarum TaxID=1612308 RepID=A0A1I3ZQS7_9HYPH|nr:LapA family protein [Methylocapsa palsarum]SFK45909.1 Protein of unknown function [Methylocapsa palsarum]